ncbi:MAG: hypothetical protein ACLPID_03530 [Beijerinckiaceae bacterium]
MPKVWTHKECFEVYGTIPKNPGWSWSGRSADGKVVSATFWQDQFGDKGRIYRSQTLPGGYSGESSPGHKELLDNPAWSRENCGGEIRIIIAIAKDTSASPRAIKECFPAEKIRMRVTHLDEATGDFIAERVEVPKDA